MGSSTESSDLLVTIVSAPFFRIYCWFFCLFFICYRTRLGPVNLCFSKRMSQCYHAISCIALLDWSFKWSCYSIWNYHETDRMSLFAEFHRKPHVFVKNRFGDGCGLSKLSRAKPMCAYTGVQNRVAIYLQSVVEDEQ